MVEVALADAREFAPRKGWNGWIVSNLPYGKRIAGERGSGSDVLGLYEDFGALLRERCV